MSEIDPGAHRNRSLVGGLVGRVAPAVIRQIDTQDLVDSLDVNLIAQSLDLDVLVDRLDVNAVAERLDLDRLVERLDVNMVAERLDLDALVDRLDVDAVAARLDLDKLVDRLDVNAVAARLDLDALVDRLDVDAVAARLDLDKLVDRLDVNAVAERLDLDALVDRMDVNAIAAELDMAKLTAGATSDVAMSGLDLARRQLIRVDATVEGVSDRVLHRGSPRPVAPGRFDPGPASAEEPETRPQELQRRDVSGHYAGPVTRALAVLGDIAAVTAVQAVLAYLALLWFGVVLDIASPTGAGRWLSIAVLGLVIVAWYWFPVALFGRTLAMAVLGIAVVRRDGGIVRWRRALVRALVMPVSLVIPLAFIGLLVGKERRALHDVISGTVVVYDWGGRDAQQPVTIREQLSARIRRRADEIDAEENAAGSAAESAAA